MKYTAIVQGKQIEIEFNRQGTDRIEAKIGSRVYRIDTKSVQPGAYWLNCDNRSLDIAVTKNGDHYVVSVAGHAVPVEIVDARAAPRRTQQHSDEGAIEMRAPMPGKIVKVLASQGSAVQVNQGILVMEAMKMQNEIKSPKKGVVRKLAVKEGAAVNSGDLLAVVE